MLLEKIYYKNNQKFQTSYSSQEGVEEEEIMWMRRMMNRIKGRKRERIDSRVRLGSEKSPFSQ
jgi:hypothetical protein